jgi:hypothetical protein
MEGYVFLPLSLHGFDLVVHYDYKLRGLILPHLTRFIVYSLKLIITQGSVAEISRSLLSPIMEMVLLAMILKAGTTIKMAFFRKLLPLSLSLTSKFIV